jgi:hypothetical protein
MADDSKHLVQRFANLRISALDAVGLSERFADALPFSHVIIDDVVDAPFFATVVGEIANMPASSWRAYRHFDERKYANQRVETWGPATVSLAQVLCSPAFVDFLGSVARIPQLLSDWSMDGGGLHEVRRNGYLNLHTDFLSHHEHTSWTRRLNLILFLGDSWDADWGGQLEFWDAGAVQCQQSIDPRPNRMVIFATSKDSIHGHPRPLECPTGSARRSLALYYYTDDGAPHRRSTRYLALPEANRFARPLVWLDNMALNLYDRVRRWRG